MARRWHSLLTGLLSLLLLAPLLWPETLTAQTVDSLDALLLDVQSVSATGGGQLTNLSINFSIPIDARVLRAPPSARRMADAQGNPYLFFFEPSPSLPFTYTIETAVHTSAQTLAQLPIEPEPLEGAATYLGSSDKVPASDPAIRRLARSIVQNATTPFEEIAMLAEWAHDYLDYNASMVGQELGTRDILVARQGVCTEYTTLFVTLSRSLGYPTRFVNGYAYSEKFNSFLGHAWAEVYLGRWVSVDPTWLEVGNLDGTHIASARAAVQDFRSASVSALITPVSAQLLWNASASRGAIADNIRESNVKRIPPDETYSLSSSSARLPSGGRFVAWAAYRAHDYRVLPVSLVACQSGDGQPIVFLSGEDQRAITEPNQTYYLIWTGQASSALERNYIYTCPLTFQSAYLARRPLVVNVSTEAVASPDWPVLSAEPASTSVQMGDQQSVFVRLPVSLAGQPVTLLEAHNQMVQIAGPDGHVAFTFPAQRSGPHTAYVFAPRGDPVVVAYSVSGPADLLITQLHTSAKLVENQPNQLQLFWQPPVQTNDSGWQMEWRWGGQRGQVSLPPAAGPLSIAFKPDAAGNFMLTLRVLDANRNERFRASEPLTALPDAYVRVRDVTVHYEDPARSRIQLQMESVGPVSDLRLAAAGRLMDVPSDGTFSFVVPQGPQPISLLWTDAAGQKRHYDFDVDASSSKASLFPPIPSLPLPILFAVALVAVFLGVVMVLKFRAASQNLT